MPDKDDDILDDILGEIDGEQEFKCPKCGEELPAGAIMCPECGTVFEKVGEEGGGEVPAEETEPGKMPCPKCGKAIPDYSKMCPFCEAILVDVEEEGEKSVTDDDLDEILNEAEAEADEGKEGEIDGILEEAEAGTREPRVIKEEDIKGKHHRKECPFCTVAIPADAKSCPSCGVSLTEKGKDDDFKHKDIRKLAPPPKKRKIAPPPKKRGLAPPPPLPVRRMKRLCETCGGELPDYTNTCPVCTAAEEEAYVPEPAAVPVPEAVAGEEPALEKERPVNILFPLMMLGSIIGVIVIAMWDTIKGHYDGPPGPFEMGLDAAAVALFLFGAALIHVKSNALMDHVMKVLMMAAGLGGALLIAYWDVIKDHYDGPHGTVSLAGFAGCVVLALIGMLLIMRKPEK